MGPMASPGINEAFHPSTCHSNNNLCKSLKDALLRGIDDVPPRFCVTKEHRFHRLAGRPCLRWVRGERARLRPGWHPRYDEKQSAVRYRRQHLASRAGAAGTRKRRTDIISPRAVVDLRRDRNDVSVWYKGPACSTIRDAAKPHPA